MKQIQIILIAIISLIFCSNCNAQNKSWSKSSLLFEDSGASNWQLKWMLDGQRSQIINTEDGIELIAGPEHNHDTCHTVLWTKQSFSGNICIEYDYTRTDTTTRCVNILYFHAKGKGDAEYPEDIALWNDKRLVPHMRTYFNNMHAYHISYAAFAAQQYSGDNDYIRARRYDPAKEGLKGTNFPEEYLKTDLFKPNVTYHIEVYKFDNQLEMHIQNIQDATDKKICTWDLSLYPSCESGRIGLRHMYTRSARYKNFKVWKIKNNRL